MAPYLLLLFFVTAAGFLFCELRKSRRSDLLFLLVTCTVMFAMSSLRGITVGVDNKLYYLPYFERMAASDISFLWSAENVYRSEPGYSLLVYLISRISDSPTVFFAVQAALAIGLTARAGVVLFILGLDLHLHICELWLFRLHNGDAASAACHLHRPSGDAPGCKKSVRFLIS